MIDILLWTITWCCVAVIIFVTFTIMYMFYALEDEIIYLIIEKLKKLRK